MRNNIRVLSFIECELFLLFWLGWVEMEYLDSVAMGTIEGR